MGAVRYLQSAFLGGETDPLLAGRVETDQYAYGLEKCENWICVNEGPLVKRQGWEYVVDADPSASWLGSFRFSVSQEYLIEWGQAKARFFTNGGRIETSPGVAYEVVTPYTAAATPLLSTQQSFDRLYIDHRGYPPAALVRTGAATFSYAVTTLNNGPFGDVNKDDAITVTVAGVLTVGGAVTVTSTAAIFDPGHVGAQFRIESKDFSTIKAWQPGMDGVFANEVVRSDGKAYTAGAAGKTGTIVPTHSEGTEYDGQGKNDVLNAKGPYGVPWAYRHDRFGVMTITGYTSATQVTGTVTRRIPDSLTTVPSPKWAHGAFSAVAGYPAVVVHGFGRQIHFKDFDCIGSVVEDYGGGQCNFETLTSSGLTAADLGFRRTLDASNPVLWALADRNGILVGTADTEIAIGPINNAAALAGDNIRALPQSSYGSEQIFPLSVGTTTAMVERGGRRIRLVDYDFSSDRYVPVDLTAAARHITRGGVVQLAWQRLPYSLLYAVRGDGQLVVHAATRLEIKGLSRIVLGGNARALSAMSIVGADGKTDELWLLVERTRADGVKREIWRQAARRELGDDVAEQFYVDAGVRVDAAGGQVHFSGLTHLAGEAVDVLVNGALVSGITVSGAGEMDLPAAAVPADPYVLVLGLNYVADAVLHRPPTQVRSGALQGLLRRVRKVVLRVLESFGITVSADGGDEEDVVLRADGDPMDAPVPLFSGDQALGIEAENTLDGKLRIVSRLPFAATVAMAVTSMEADEADG
ncbi:MAG: hypothetical protein K2W91_04680 [Novosphingobium sp.]|nr:hypothetical protein [Novosphingobium sp.]